MKLKRFLTPLAAAGLLSAATAQAAVVNVTTDITGNESWYATNTYILQKVVYVQTNAVLTIEPGTVIKGATNVATLQVSAGIPNLVSALWVTRGGKLYATGTVERPIIFTFEGDDVNNPNDVPPTLTGQWGGIVLCGKGQINSAQDATGNGSSPRFEVFEGTTGIGGTIPENIFGGNDDTDSSGTLRYVSIRHPGNVFASGKELNGLTMGGVGSGTDISYIEVFASSDDAFEWWGGNVSTHHLVAAFCEDDDFDTDQGYRGTNQFWFGIKPPGAGSTDSRGFETDGDLSQTGYPGGNASPASSWAVYNATLIGRGKANSSFGGGRAWNARDEARPNVFNSTFTEFNQGLLVDSDDINEFTTLVATLGNSVLNVESNAYSANATFLSTNANSELNPLLGGVSYTNNLGLNPRPLAGSPLLTNVLSGAPVSTTYRGAFGTNDMWAHKWSGIYKLGYLQGTYVAAVVVPSPNPVTLTITPNGANVDITCTSQSGYSYQLESTTSLTAPISWGNEGAAQTGTGSTLTFPVSATGAKYFRVVAN